MATKTKGANMSLSQELKNSAAIGVNNMIPVVSTQTEASAPVSPVVPREEPKVSTIYTQPFTQTVTSQSTPVSTTVTQEVPKKKNKEKLVGIHVTEDEQKELRQIFCSNGFSLATAYRAAMSYLRQDMEDGKAYLTNNGEIRRK